MCEALPLGKARALVGNASNSNAFTGNRGRAAVEAIAARVAGHLGCQPSDVFVSSTGVIGVPLPIDKAEAGLDAAFAAPPCGWEEAAATIMTRSEEHTSELQSLMRISYAVFCLT